MAANHARRIDPSLAAKYHRLMTTAGKHHNSALCHIATTLLTRIAACWRAEAALPTHATSTATPSPRRRPAQIIAQHYTVPVELARPTRGPPTEGTSRRIKESQSAPSTGPSTTHPKTTQITA